MTYIKPLPHYNVNLIFNHNGKNNRTYYDVKIKHKQTGNFTIIKDFSPSPMLTCEYEKIEDALSFIVDVAHEWYDDKRDDGDGFFEKTYNQLSMVMSIEDMQTLQLYFYDKENDTNDTPHYKLYV